METQTISDQQSALYDRQIRLWGIEAQKRLQDSKVLLCGIRGLHLEVAKNLALAGISLTIQDSSIISAEDLSSNYFFNITDIGKNRAAIARERIQDLNHYVTVNSDERILSNLDESFLKDHSVVILSDCSQADAIRMNKICRRHGSSFFWDDCYGLEGCFIADLGESFECKKDPPQNATEILKYPNIVEVCDTLWRDIPTKHSPLSKTFVGFIILSRFRDSNSGNLPTLEDISALSTFAKDLLVHNAIEPDFLNTNDLEKLCICTNCGMNISVCAVLGGFLSQEVVKAISHVGRPIHNAFVFSADDCVGRSFSIV